MLYKRLPAYIFDLLILYTTPRPLRSSDQSLLVVLRAQPKLKGDCPTTSDLPPSILIHSKHFFCSYLHCYYKMSSNNSCVTSFDNAGWFYLEIWVYAQSRVVCSVYNVFTEPVLVPIIFFHKSSLVCHLKDSNAYLFYNWLNYEVICQAKLSHISSSLLPKCDDVHISSHL